MPSHSTLSNHAEDVVSMYSAALKERHGDESKTPFLSLPLRVDTEMHGLILVATKKEFCSYMSKQLESTSSNGSNGNTENGNIGHVHATAVKKNYRCLVCIKDPDDIDRIENMVNKTLEHFVDPKSPSPKKFLRNKPKSSHHEWQQCLMRITNVGSTKFRAACVSSMYSDSNDFTLAHRLWGPNEKHPAEDLGVTYVMQLDVELLTSRIHQIRGQLAALGCPIVGDALYGGGTCEMRMHRHMWQRMAVQCCSMEFGLPRWEENEDRKILVPTEEMCVFKLHTAWWTEYLVDYERYI